MSSLLQFNGKIEDGKVGLLFYLERPGPWNWRQNWDRYESILGPWDESIGQCKGRHYVLYRVWRKPVGMFGCWVLFRYLGETHAPDLSLPIATHKLPIGAQRLSDDEIIEYWTSP